jgi:hypothetical protein
MPMFDATTYGPGPGKPTRAKPEPPAPRLVYNNGEWYIVTHHKKTPHDLAHRLDMKMTTTYRLGRAHITGWDGRSPWQGAWKTRCGLIGAVVELPHGDVNACPACERL